MDKSTYEKLGLKLDRSPNRYYLDSPLNLLVERAVALGYGKLPKHGALAVETGEYTGRCAKDRYVVKTDSTSDKVWWENNIHPMTTETFNKLKSKVIDYLNTDRDLYITERCVGADKKLNIGARLVTTHPQHALFSKYLFRHKLRPLGERDFTILHAPELQLDPSEFGTRSEVCVVTDFDQKITIICGTLYAGEIKKSMFSVMNYQLPSENVLPMHAGSSQLHNKEVSVFFGLSGTGKTTLSCDEGVDLIGDDEHGMSADGLFNFEGGCYAKTYKLSRASEPGIFSASSQFGSMLENVVITETTGEPDFFNKSLSENGRSSYPLDFIKALESSSRGKLPSHIFFLTADAFGILPPVAKLTKEQAMFYFVLGYTAKVAGTEIGIKEPEATFSPCFGAPFMLRHPSVYANLLGDLLDKHGIKVWLINTGWTGGPYGVGQRFPLNITRQIIRTIQKNTLNLTPTETDPVFGFDVPQAVRNVPTSFLHPRDNWGDPEKYDVQSKELAMSFHNQMKEFGDFYDVNIKGAPLYNG